jgi:hypothetical protein
MAFRTKKISQMDPKGANLASTDLLEISELVSGSYVTKSITGAEIVASVPPSVTAWGTITGTLSSQTDLNTALSGKVPTTRTISTTAPLTGGGDMSANRTLSIATANTTTTGALSSTDWNTFNGKQSAISLTTTGTGAATFVSNVLNVPTPAAATFSSLTTTGSSGASTLTSGVLNVPTYSLSGLGGVPTTRTLTINGTTQDLSVDRTFTISTGITIGTTAITSGTVGRVLFEGTGNVVSESANLFWDNTNGRLGIGTSSPIHPLTINGRALIGTATNIGSGTGLTALQVSAIGTSPIQILSDSTKVFGLTYEYNSAATSFYIYSDYYTGAIEPKLTFGTFTNKTNQLVLNKTGNIGINTTTDAGFKLDVNGTVRVQGNLTLTSAFQIKFANNNRWIGPSELYAGVQIYAAASGSDVIQMTVGQQVHISSAGGITTQASSVLQVDSTTKGFLPPRMTTTQKNAIASPATGLQVFDSTLNRPCFYDGTTWITL